MIHPPLYGQQIYRVYFVSSQEPSIDACDGRLAIVRKTLAINKNDLKEGIFTFISLSPHNKNNTLQKIKQYSTVKINRWKIIVYLLKLFYIDIVHSMARLA